MTRGTKSSERRAIYHAFIVNVLIVLYAINKGETANLAGILGAINTLPMAYVFGRSYVKSKQGE